jgi:hypothetical protein
MPVLDKSPAKQELQEPPAKKRTNAWFPVCANPKCASGWLHVWRRRTSPIIEGGWSCSVECTRALIADLLHRERIGYSRPAAMHRHRIPIGLVLLTEGWVSHKQLRSALEAQKSGAHVRVGAWLMEHCGLEERRITQALSIQWNCPILELDDELAAPAVSVLPRLFLETFGFLPVRLSAAGILYIAFEDRMDHSLTLAIERMTSLRVEAGLVNGSEFRSARNSVLTARFPRVRLVEAASMEAAVDALTAIVEKSRPLQVRVVRVHDFYWFRLWKQSGHSLLAGQSAFPEGVEDVICSLVSFQ